MQAPRRRCVVAALLMSAAMAAGPSTTQMKPHAPSSAAESIRLSAAMSFRMPGQLTCSQRLVHGSCTALDAMSTTETVARWDVATLNAKYDDEITLRAAHGGGLAVVSVSKSDEVDVWSTSYFFHFIHYYLDIIFGVLNQ